MYWVHCTDEPQYRAKRHQQPSAVLLPMSLLATCLLFLITYPATTILSTACRNSVNLTALLGVSITPPLEGWSHPNLVWLLWQPFHTNLEVIVTPHFYQWLPNEVRFNAFVHKVTGQAKSELVADRGSGTIHR